MATFTELCDDVVTITNRPDLVAETKLAVKAATLKAHQLDFFFKDLFETGVMFDAADYNQQLQMTTVVPRYRALSYFRRYDNTGSGAPAEFFTIVSPLSIKDDYSVDKVNIIYAAGAVFNVKCAVKFQYALMGVYVNPDITEAGYTSWIAVDHPYAIVFEAARLLFKQIGFDEQSAAFERLVAEQFGTLKLSNVQAAGY